MMARTDIKTYTSCVFVWKPYFLGPYLGATVAALFWMTANYVRHNYDQNYTQPANDDGRDMSHDDDVTDQRCIEDDQRK